MRFGSEPSPTLTRLLLFAALATYFVGLGSPPLWDANEPLYAQPPNEALNWPQGDILAPTWNGRPYFAHPPLSTWITLPFYAVFGPSEWSHRLPLALVAALLVWGTYRLGRALGGPRIALLAALILAATPRVWLFARQLPGDVHLTAILVWAWSLALPHVTGERTQRGSLRAAHVLVGLGCLAKGPVVIALYFGVLFFTWLGSKPRASWSYLRPWRAIALTLVLGAPWFVYMGLRYADVDFLGQHFGHYHAGRVLGSIGERGWLFYPRVLIGDGQPWISVLPFGAWMAWRARDRRAVALLPWAGLLWVVALFSLSLGKRGVYLLPLYPLLALCVAPPMEALWRGVSRAGLRLAGSAAALGCASGCVLLLILAYNEPRLWPEIGALLGVGGLACVPLLVAGWQGRGRLLCGGALATVLAGQFALALALPALERFRPVPVLARRIVTEQDARAPEPAIIYRVSIHSLNFYLGRPTRVASDPLDLLAKLEGAPSAFLLVPADRFEEPGKGSEASPVGLASELPEATFVVLDRRPLLNLKFRSAILGEGPTTRDLLLVRMQMNEPAEVVLARRRREATR
ncbi:MAG: glycosyltransferase family 39 protein [Planctomycetota bacterium]|nr:glycosyltransferase family 39 protein [Planctomycetota bacterium]